MPSDVKEAAYRGRSPPFWNMAVLDPYGVVLQQEIEKVQNRAARFRSLYGPQRIRKLQNDPTTTVQKKKKKKKKKIDEKGDITLIQILISIRYS